jgi:hypothetical protein
MKNQFLKLGKRLSRKEQQEIRGGMAFASCEHFCRGSWRDRAWYLKHQLETYGLDWSHCECRN